MPNPDDILKAMRSAGEEFARMADTVEEKLPSIAKALSRAPRQLKPLIRSLDEIAKKAEGIKLDRLVTDLAEADKGAGRFLQTLSKVDRHLRDSARVVAAMASSHRDLTIESQKSIRAVSAVAEKVNSTISKSLARRTSEFKDLSREADKASRNFQTPADGGGGGPMRGRPGAHLADNKDHANRQQATARAARRLREDFAGMESELSPIKEHFYGIEEGLKGLSGLIVKSRADLSKLSPEGMLEWGRSAVGQIDQLIAASEKFPGLEPISAKKLRNIRAAAAGMEDMTENADGMRDVLEGVGKQLEEMKSSGRGLNKALLRDIQRLADETGAWYGVSKKNQSELVTWRVKHQKAAERMVERGIRPSWAYAVQLGKAVKSVPIKALADEAKEMGGALRSALKSVTGISSFTATGIAKGFLDTEHSIIAARQELIEMTSKAGELSAMWSAGLNADEVKGEFDRLRDSMNNMLDTWGVTRKDAQASTKALLDAGFSMSSILGPTLKVSDGFLGFAKAGEHAMTGLDELGKLTRITGRSMGDIANLAGQWREKLGVTIGQVGDTYLELESSARRSGMSVGKFMDRVMASTSGFVMFGGQVDNVAKSLSSLMSGMKLPPDVAGKIAGDFMDQLQKTTWEEALVTTSFLGSAGRDLAAQNFKDWTESRASMVRSLDTEVDTLKKKLQETTGEERQMYSKLLGDARNRRTELQGGIDKVSALLAKGQVDLAFQHLARMGEGVAANVKLMADAFATQTWAGRAAKKAIEDGTGEQEALTIFLEEASKAEGNQLRLLQSRAKELGYENEAAMLAHYRSRVSGLEMLKKYATIAGHDAKALKSLVDMGGIDDIAAALEQTARTPKELQERLVQLQAAGYDVADTAFKAISESVKAFDAAIDPAAQADAMRQASEATARVLADVVAKPKPEVKDLQAHAATQTSKQTLIEEHLADIRNKHWPKMFGVMAIIKGIMMARAAGDVVGTAIDMFSGSKGIGRLLKRFSKAGRATSRASKAIRAARAARRAGNVAKAAKLASKARPLAQAARAARAAQAAKAGTGVVARAVGGVGRVTTAAGTRIAATGVGRGITTAGTRIAASGVGRGVATAGRVGMRGLRALGRIPYLAALIEPAIAAVELHGTRSAAAADARQRSKAMGDAEEETERKVARAKTRATTKGATGKFAGAAIGGAGAAILGGIVGQMLIPIPGVGAAIGMAVAGWFGGKAGGAAGEAIGNALETEADRFGRKIEELYDLGTLDDASAAIKVEEERRAALNAEKQALIQKEIDGEKLTHDERERLQALQRELYGEEAKLRMEQLEQLKKNKQQDEYMKEYKAGMATRGGALAGGGAAFRGEALRKQRDLERKEREGGLTKKEEGWLEKAKVASKMSNEDIAKYKMEQERKVLSDLSIKGEADKARIAEIDKKLAGPATVRPPAPKESLTTVERLKAEGATTAAGAVRVDKSTWTVHINTRSDKEMEQAMLKVIYKHGQKMEN